MVDTVLNFLGDLPWWVWALTAVFVLCWGMQSDRIGSAIVLTIAVSLIGVGLHGIWSSGLPQATVSSLAQHFSRIQAEKVRVAAIRKDGEELYYRAVCPEYFEQSWIDRKLSTASWCEDYRDRF
ncbi:hypothetical protein [Agrobacterium pusense]|uniref:hypothetical protein n=1 Tax=Agrobacterium pusense TaxID=648995 RepID=UPI000D38C115|nr:hypothetical protein [Agrobacterium pusense]PTV70190.1 hypothetical protein DBL06_25335 [Agrobacterium pusense]